MKKASCVIVVLLFCGSTAYGKDMANRLGIGYSNQQVTEALPSLTAQYYPNPKMGISLALGVDTLEEASQFGLLFKLYRIVFSEENLNFYMGGGAGLISLEAGGSGNTGFEVMGFVGAEYFLPGLENLGFSFEAGFGVVADSEGARFRTLGYHPLLAGIIFYF